MTLADAKRLREEIRAQGLHCTVPLGLGPDGYVARIVRDDGPLDFLDRAQWLTYNRRRKRRNARIEREYNKLMARSSQRRSPIEMMIDRACGLE